MNYISKSEFNKLSKYEAKSYILNSPLYNEYVRLKKALYMYDTYFDKESGKFIDLEGEVIEYNCSTLSSITDLYIYYERTYPYLWKECQRIYHAKISRTNRLKKRVEKMLSSGQCIFLTITFNNKVLGNTSSRSRRDYVRKYLNSLTCPYVGNIDFGKKNNREHYHALVQSEFVKYTDWKNGNCDGEKIRLNSTNEDVQRLARYVAKLTNHAIKSTTKNSYILYSRKFK